MYQRVRYSAAICPALISSGRLLHSRIARSPASVGVSSATSMRRHREAIPRRYRVRGQAGLGAFGEDVNGFCVRTTACA